MDRSLYASRRILFCTKSTVHPAFLICGQTVQRQFSRSRLRDDRSATCVIIVKRIFEANAYNQHKTNRITAKAEIQKAPIEPAHFGTAGSFCRQIAPSCRGRGCICALPSRCGPWRRSRTPPRCSPCQSSVPTDRTGSGQSVLPPQKHKRNQETNVTTNQQST